MMLIRRGIPGLSGFYQTHKGGKHLPKCNESGRRFHRSAFTLTDVPGNRVAAFDLRASDDIPDAGHPVSQQSKGRHEQRQNHSAVLGVTIQFLQQAQQTEQTNCF